MLDRTDTEITTNADTNIKQPLSKEGARRCLQHYKDNGQARPTIRMLARDWAWSSATTGRFVQAFDAEQAVTEAKTETPSTVSSSTETEPTPHERRQMLIRAGEHFDEVFKQETPAELVDRLVAERKIDLAGPEEADGYHYWGVPSQRAIEAREAAGGAVELWQECQSGSEEGFIINIAAGNAVAVARSVLYAAGFKNILIATLEKGGYVDVDDGQLAANFGKGR